MFYRGVYCKFVDRSENEHNELIRIADSAKCTLKVMLPAITIHHSNFLHQIFAIPIDIQTMYQT